MESEWFKVFLVVFFSIDEPRVLKISIHRRIDFLSGAAPFRPNLKGEQKTSCCVAMTMTNYTNT